MRSPLAVAARCAAPGDDHATARCAAIASALVEYGADVDGCDSMGWSPLFHAARARNVLMLETLLALNASEGLTERYNDEDIYSGHRRTYVEHARRFASPDDDECRLGSAAARRACGALRAYCGAGLTSIAADRGSAADRDVGRGQYTTRTEPPSKVTCQ